MLEGTAVFTMNSDGSGINPVVVQVQGLQNRFSDTGLGDLGDELATLLNQEIIGQGVWSVGAIEMVERRTV